MPQAPMVEPIDRSNSPPIISSATATARIPSLSRDLQVVGRAAQRQESAVAGDDRKEDPDHDGAGERAELRPDSRRRKKPVLAMRSSSARRQGAWQHRATVTSASLDLTCGAKSDQGHGIERSRGPELLI